MDFLGTYAASTLSLLTVSLVTWLVVKWWRSPKRRKGVLELSRDGREWTIRNVSGRTLYEFKYDPHSAGDEPLGSRYLWEMTWDLSPDIPHRIEGVSRGNRMSFMWIDRTGRRYASYRVEGDEKVHHIKPDPLPRRRLKLVHDR